MNTTRALYVCVLLTSVTVPLQAQTIDDGTVLPRHRVVVGDVYSQEDWDEYWEGTLKRTNGNIGTLTTRVNTWFANYGLTDRVTLLGAFPHVRTNASQGVLHDVTGLQDLTIAAKYLLFERGSPVGSLRGIAVGAAGIPLTDYTPDFFPLSIGTGSKRGSGRFTLHTQGAAGWFASGSTAYTWRAGVTLDRPYYYTDGRLFLTDQVDMPNVFDYIASAGYAKRGWMLGGSFSQQVTLGGGDIRRQDMPFVSNRMNFSRVGAAGGLPVPKLDDLSIVLSWNYTLDGRNVGQATTFSGGLAYRLRVFERSAQ